MSASHSAVLHVTALQAAAALARYEGHVRALAGTWLDMELYEQVSGEIDEIKAFCAGMPQVTVAWSALLVSHAELIHALWKDAHMAHPAGTEPADRLLAEHIACIRVLSWRCLRVAAEVERQGRM